MLLVGILLAGATYADTAPSWSRLGNFAGNGEDRGASVKVDKLGNRYVTGSFSGTATFNGQALVSSGDTDIFLAKFAQDGSLLWVVRAGGVGHDEGTRTGIGETIFLAKYSPTGSVVWVFKGVQVSTNNITRGFGMAINASAGSIYMTGLAQGATDFTSADGHLYEVPGPWTWHMFLVKYDLRGQFQWGQSNEASPNSVPHRVAVDASNNAYVTGWFEAQAIFHSADGNDQTITGLSGPVQTFPDYPSDAFLVKYDGNGNLQWVNDIGGYKAIGNDIAASSSGSVSITGFIGNISGGSSTQAQTIVTSQAPGANINLGGGQFTNPYNRDVFVATYDHSGVLQNALRIGGANHDAGSGITYDDLGNLYVSGVFQGMIEVGGQTLNGTQANNLFVLKYTSGSLAWAVEADGAGTQDYEQNPRLGTRPGSNKVFVTGAYSGTATFGNINLHSAGADEVFAMALK